MALRLNLEQLAHMAVSNVRRSKKLQWAMQGVTMEHEAATGGLHSGAMTSTTGEVVMLMMVVPIER